MYRARRRARRDELRGDQAAEEQRRHVAAAEGRSRRDQVERPLGGAAEAAEQRRDDARGERQPAHRREDREPSLEKVPSAVAADKAGDANTVGGYTVRRFASTVAPNGPEATVLSLNGLVVTMTCPGGAVALRANNASGEGAQLRFDGFAGNAGTGFAGGSGDFAGTTNANLNNDANRGSGSAYYIRANGTGVTVLYGWREDALGGASACRVFGQAISG